MNRILIMGDKGFVGSHIRAALESTYDVVAAVKSSKSACKIRGIRIIGVENPSHSVQIIMKFTIYQIPVRQSKKLCRRHFTP